MKWNIHYSPGYKTKNIGKIYSKTLSIVGINKQLNILLRLSQWQLLSLERPRRFYWNLWVSSGDGEDCQKRFSYTFSCPVINAVIDWPWDSLIGRTTRFVIGKLFMSPYDDKPSVRNFDPTIPVRWCCSDLDSLLNYAWVPMSVPVYI